ncbi:MAG: aminoacyltransferase [Solobacterium sp.]|nr:aminoacyltransferase [Solobacterium sp.]
MILKEIHDRETFDAFVSAHPYAHYMKTSMWGEDQQRQTGCTYKMLGFFEGDELKASAMALFGKFFFHPYIYIPKGPCTDYEDAGRTEEVFGLLKEYAAEKKVHFLRTDPNVLRMEKDIFGNVIEGGENHEDVTERLKGLGFIHKGYGYAYNGSWTNRYTLTVDLSDDFKTISSRFAKSRLTSLNRHKINCVTTRCGNKEDIPHLMELEKQLAEQDGFRPHSRQFFEDILECFGDHASVYVTEIDLAGMIGGIEAELASKKYRKDPEARAAKEKSLQKTAELKAEYGERPVICCGIFVRTGETSYDLYAYNHKAFGHLNPVDSMHFFAMQDMKAHGVKTYDMCGFSGVTTKDDPEYGLYEYKRSFGAQYIEQIGEFDYPLNKKALERFKLEKRIEVKLRRAYISRKYKKA